MKLSDFILLSEGNKKQAVMHKGVLVGKRQNVQYMIFLFQFDTYYVETFCNLQNKQVEEFRAFDTLVPLSPYLEAISIDDLLN